MKISVKKLDDNKREIIVEAGDDIVKNKFEDVFKKITQEAKVPGFRPGHAPRDLVEKHYGSAVHEQVLKELVPDIYNQAIDKEGLDVIELPQITDVKLNRESLILKATVEVSPEIEVKNYKGIKIDYRKVEVTADDIKRSIDSVKESRKLEKADESFAKTLGYPSMQELEKTFEKQIYLHKENQERQRIENEIILNISKGLDFKVPQLLVERQLQDMLRQTKVDLAIKGVAREKIEEQEKTMLSELEPEARNQVKIYLILSAIAKKENITLDDHMPRHVMEFLLREADWKEAA
ncbi:MAG: trigger factor [Candidatus Omnitrophota bacterium]|jgi:FKBP-type peptidyl-prolyl cis-trans isomerase (trigger factor)